MDEAVRIKIFSGALALSHGSGDFRTGDAFPGLLKPLASRHRDLVLASRTQVAEDQPHDGHVRLGDTAGLRFEPLPFFRNHADALRRWPRIAYETRPIVERLVSQSDVVVLRLPFPMASVVCRAAAKQRVPIVGYWATAPLATTASSAYQHSGGLVRAASNFTAKVLDYRHELLAQNFAWNLLTDPLDPRLSTLERASSLLPSLVRSQDISDAPNARPAAKRLRVLFAARLEEVKGILDLLDAIETLEHPEKFDFEIVGEGSLLPIVRRRSEELGAQITVRGQLSHSDVMKAMNDSHVVVMPSYAEGTPKVLSETWATGNALITSLVNGVQAYVTTRDAALVVKPGDVRGLADALACLEQDEALRFTLAQNGLRNAADMTHDTWTETFLSGVESALDFGVQRSSRSAFGAWLSAARN